MAPPRGPIDFWGQLTPLNWMISFRSSILGVICSNYIIYNNLHLLWHGKVYSNIWRDHPWMTITSFIVPMKLTLKSGASIGHQITFPSPRVG
jgi:hypothetical protein